MAKIMAKYVFSYNAKYQDYTSQEIREEVIKFLDRNGAKRIRQCLDTTLVFNSSKNSTHWETKIKRELTKKDHVLEDGFFLLTRVYYYEQRHAIKRRCNPDLQDFVDQVLEN